MDFNEDRANIRSYVVDQLEQLAKTRAEVRAYLKTAFSLSREPNGRDACLLYLKIFVGLPVDGRELEIVSGIPTYGRRLRELRVEHGYEIVTKKTSSGDAYVLESEIPNEARAALWKNRNAIRRTKGSGENRILLAFKMSLGVPLDIDDLIHVSKIKTARERVRDLRLNKGWRIAGKKTGRPDLRPTQYVLQSLVQLPQHDRHIPDDIYDDVMKKYDKRCGKCGWSRKDWSPDSRRQYVEVHHKKLHSKGGDHTRTNLIVLCNVHHVEVHRQKIDRDQINAWLQP